MRNLSLCFIFSLLVCSCSSPPNTSPVTSTAEPSSHEIVWEPTHFLQEVGVDVQNVTDLLVAEDGRVFAVYYDESHTNYVAYTEDDGGTWEWSTLPEGVTYARALLQLSDGSFMLAVTGSGPNPLLYTSKNGVDWSALETDGAELPTRDATTAWDLIELEDGRIVIATASKDDSVAESQSIFLLDGTNLSQSQTWLDGSGVLSLAMDSEGVLYAATQQSVEHNDPELAGQSSIYRSTDDGETWEMISQPEGANRIYDMLITADGRIFLGTGISGNFYISEDGGLSWSEQSHVPETINKPASRIYQILELLDGSLLVGTGNKTGSIFLTSDNGASWEKSSETGKNIVTWALAQDPATGTLWAGTGSFGGDVWKAEY